MPARQSKIFPCVTVDVVEDGGDWSGLADPESIVQAAVDAVARVPGVVSSDATLVVALSTDAAVAKLNADFRGKAKATNVLSFPAGKGAAPYLLGDIILAAETVQREAVEQSTPFTHHVQHLVVHGFLHLIGYDHETAGDAERMEALEIEILASLDIANPYTGELQPAQQE